MSRNVTVNGATPVRVDGASVPLPVKAAFGAVPTADRVVFDGDVVTAAGVSAGIDMALALTARLAGDDVARTIQLAIEYDPQPPFDAGAPRKASPAIREAATRLLGVAS